VTLVDTSPRRLECIMGYE